MNSDFYRVFCLERPRVTSCYHPFVGLETWKKHYCETGVIFFVPVKISDMWRCPQNSRKCCLKTCTSKYMLCKSHTKLSEGRSQCKSIILSDKGVQTKVTSKLLTYCNLNDCMSFAIFSLFILGTSQKIQVPVFFSYHSEASKVTELKLLFFSYHKLHAFYQNCQPFIIV